LDDPVGASLAGPHAGFAVRSGRVARYAPEVAPFASLGGDPEGESWTGFAAVGAGVLLLDPERPVSPPDGWRTTWKLRGVQMIDTGMTAAPDAEAVRLGAADVPDILDLVGRTRPGPFLLRTVELGSYLGIRRDGKLLAMAGERMHPPGYTEISAVCTDPAARGQGLASRLMRAVAHGIRARGETPILHAASTNTTAIRLYEKLGFVVRREFDFVGLETPSP
jgi:ribosomal protein S18 acetylase RimI-like enzyme